MCIVGVPELGRKLDQLSWITEQVDAQHAEAVKKMLVDWELYENGSSLGIRTRIFENVK